VSVKEKARKWLKPKEGDKACIPYTLYTYKIYVCASGSYIYLYENEYANTAN